MTSTDVGTQDHAAVALHARLNAARDLAQVAGDRLPSKLQGRLDRVVSTSSRRLAVAGDHTVAVLAGPTGVGKSSLFNAVLGSDIATVGVLRPTTSQPTAAVVSTEPVAELMAHLGLGGWHNVAVSTHPDLASLVLVDLPDHDSVASAHRKRAAQMVAVADRLLWVVDPEKYADATVHDDLLAPLRDHAGVLTVVMNRIDRLDLDHREEVIVDLRRLLRRDGLGGVEVVATSTVTGAGIDDLRALLQRAITDQQAANERIAADLTALAGALQPHVPPANAATMRIDEVVTAAMAAGGVPTVLEAVTRSHRHRARRATGWPPLRRFQARGRDPLARLGLGKARQGGDVGGRSSRPLPHGIATATLATAVRGEVDRSTRDWPDAWTESVELRLDDVVEALPVRLDRAILATDLEDTRRPGWWTAVGALQWLGTATAALGALWLLAAFVVAWFQLPDLPMPGWEGIAYPTMMVVGGVVLGLLVGAVSTQLARVGATRATRRVRRRLQERVHDVVEDTVSQSLAAETSRAAAARAQLDIVAG